MITETHCQDKRLRTTDEWMDDIFVTFLKQSIAVTSRSDWLAVQRCEKMCAVILGWDKCTVLRFQLDLYLLLALSKV